MDVIAGGLSIAFLAGAIVAGLKAAAVVTERWAGVGTVAVAVALTELAVVGGMIVEPPGQVPAVAALFSGLGAGFLADGVTNTLGTAANLIKTVPAKPTGP